MQNAILLKYKCKKEKSTSGPSSKSEEKHTAEIEVPLQMYVISLL